ncbi:TatD family hydrolase [Variovorax sp. VNK109]|uniref:TatD family hydrolase n=1 Tax=Variovorax sp. VNK109 TaxID=3400919 RepID=UPI003C0A4F54
MSRWIDSHCHLDAPEFDTDRAAMRQRAAEAGVVCCILPAVQVSNFATVREQAHQFGDAYALGIHPLFTPRAQEADIDTLAAELDRHLDDPRLVAIGEIGLDHFVEGLDRDRQEWFYREQLKLARDRDLPVILHVRRSADRLLKGLRDIGSGSHAWHGIAHAFNGSDQQAQAFLDMGFKLGFGGAFTHERALQLRRLATGLPLTAIVLETDAPDIPPAWLYRTAAEREAGQPQGRNEPAQLPRIAQVLADLRGITVGEIADAVWHNTLAAVPRLSSVPGVVA